MPPRLSNVTCFACLRGKQRQTPDKSLTVSEALEQMCIHAVPYAQVASWMQVTQSTLDAEKVPLLASACLVVAIMLFTGCLSTSQVHKCLKWDIYLTVACAIGISNALQESGTAGVIANGLISAGALCCTACLWSCAGRPHNRVPLTIGKAAALRWGQ